jgi:hypothetical protein
MPLAKCGKKHLLSGRILPNSSMFPTGMSKVYQSIKRRILAVYLDEYRSGTYAIRRNYMRYCMRVR